MVTVQEKTKFKDKLVEACMLRQQSLIDDFTDRIKALTETDGLGNEESYDNSQMAANTIRVSEINTLNNALEFANYEMRILEVIKGSTSTIQSEAALGAVVATNRNTFFVCVSIEEFEVDGESLIGISTQSPIFKAMSGKRMGERFSYRGLIYKIEHIF